MIVLRAGSAGFTQIAGSSAASPVPGTGSVSTVAATVKTSAGRQLTVVDRLSLHMPSDPVTVTNTEPTAVQVKLGVRICASENVPLGADQVKVSGLLFRSWAAAVRPREDPTRVSAGTADSSSATGQTLTVPPMWTEPLLAGSRH